MKNVQPRNNPGHLCNAPAHERQRVLQQIRCLMEKIGNAPCVPDPPYTTKLTFLCEKQPKYTPDPDDIPHITNIPVFELRPTSEYRTKGKTAKEVKNMVYINVDGPPNTHITPPWESPKPYMYECPDKLPCPVSDCLTCPFVKGS